MKPRAKPLISKRSLPVEEKEVAPTRKTSAERPAGLCAGVKYRSSGVVTESVVVVEPEGVSEPALVEKNWWEEDVQPTKGVEVKLASCKPLVVASTVD